jgi:hypothetical protein
MKMSSGSSAVTIRFGTSTVWLMRRSTAQLHSAYACRRSKPRVPRVLEHVRVGELVAEEPEPGHLDGVAALVPRVRFDRHDLGFEEVSRLSSLDERRPGERMDRPQLQLRDVGGGRPRSQLRVERVARLVDDGVARIDLRGGLDRLAPAVVPVPLLQRERLGHIDLDDMLAWHVDGLADPNPVRRAARRWAGRPRPWERGR